MVRYSGIQQVPPGYRSQPPLSASSLSLTGEASCTPLKKWYPDRKEGGRCRRIEKVGGSECRFVMNWIGPRKVEIPNSKGCRRPTGLDGKESIETPASLEKLDGEWFNH